MDFIVTWETNFGPSRWQRIRAIVLQKGIMLPLDGEVANEPILEPCINHGRWIIRCPWCNNAELASDDELFFCSNCCNAAMGRRQVRAPFPKERLEIETALVKRPLVGNRNWEPHEPLELLLADNASHGVK